MEERYRSPYEPSPLGEEVEDEAEVEGFKVEGRHSGKFNKVTVSIVLGSVIGLKQIHAILIL